jgi:hypothetical protein
MSKAQRESVMQSLKEGQVHFLLVSPEAIAGGTMSFLNSAASLPPISFVCIDECSESVVFFVFHYISKYILKILSKITFVSLR